MQADYTIFQIPNQAQAEKPASVFETKETEALKISNVATGMISYKPAEGEFLFFEELNQIAEELEKCRLRNS